MKIRQLSALSPETLDQLSDLLIAVVDDDGSVGFLPPLSQAEARAFWNQVLKPGVLLWVAEEDGQIQGTVQLHLCQKPNARHRAEVAKLLVHPRARRRGIGRRLMEVLEAAAREAGITLLVLDTREGDPSNRLYLSLGFQQYGRVPEYARSASGQLDACLFYYKLLPR
ncbi:MAG: GNAT family N-acetyltransferase [Bacillota bacterium]